MTSPDLSTYHLDSAIFGSGKNSHELNFAVKIVLGYCDFWFWEKLALSEFWNIISKFCGLLRIINEETDES